MAAKSVDCGFDDAIVAPAKQRRRDPRGHPHRPLHHFDRPRRMRPRLRVVAVERELRRALEIAVHECRDGPFGDAVLDNDIEPHSIRKRRHHDSMQHRAVFEPSSRQRRTRRASSTTMSNSRQRAIVAHSWATDTGKTNVASYSMTHADLGTASHATGRLGGRCSSLALGSSGAVPDKVNRASIASFVVAPGEESAVDRLSELHRCRSVHDVAHAHPRCARGVTAARARPVRFVVVDDTGGLDPETEAFTPTAMSR